MILIDFQDFLVISNHNLSARTPSILNSVMSLQYISDEGA